MDKNKLAQALFGNERDEEPSRKSEPAIIYGKAVSDSSNGMVEIEVDGHVTVTNGSAATIKIPTTPHVTAGDDVMVIASGGTGKTGMAVFSNPGSGDNTHELAEQAERDAARAATAAENAEASAEQAAESAEAAEDSASDAAAAATQAVADAGAAAAAASQAQTSAGNAAASASAAATSASNAESSASQAADSAEAAEDSASDAAAAAAQAIADAGAAAAAAQQAETKATQATTAANSALVQLGTVEDVLGTVNWIAEHGSYSLTTDTQVDTDKVYYTRTGSGTAQDPYVYTEVAEPTQAGLSTYYELTVNEAVSQYVNAHLSLTNAGLYVLKDNSGYKVLLSNTGMIVYDPSGRAVATYGEGITFDSNRPITIGNSNAYIEYYDSNNDGIADSLRIKADSVSIGTTSVSSELNRLDGVANAAQSTANAAQSAANALATRVTTAETNIEQNQHDIALKANSSDVYTKTQTDGLISTEVTNRNAAITTASNAITASVAETYSTKAELEKKTNLLLDTDVPTLAKVNATGQRYWSDSGNASYITCELYTLESDKPDTSLTYGAKYTLASNVGTKNRSLCWGTGSPKLKGGVTYTVSFYYRVVSGSAKVRAAVYDGGGTVHEQTVGPVSAGGWNLFTYTFTITTDSGSAWDRWYFYIGASGNSEAAVVEECGFRLVAGDSAESVRSYASSEFTVQADAINSKVSKNGVISEINQSPESVTINANRVNIEGAAIFTSGRLSQTSLNNAYDQNGAASAAQAAAISAAASDATSKANAAQSAAISAAASDATSKANAAQTAATNAAKSYTDTAVSNIEVGGRNLLKLSDWTVRSNYNNFVTGPFADATSPSGIVMRITPTSFTSNTSCYLNGMKSKGGMIDGENYVAEAWIRATKAVTNVPNMLLEVGSNAKRLENEPISTEWQRYSVSFTYNENTSYQAWYVIHAQTFSGMSSGDYLEIGGMQIVSGNKALDYMPAPEDLASASTGIYYATCETVAATAVKVATTEQSGFSLVPGAMVNVKFTATNSAAVANLKLNVNDTGEKPIKYIYNNTLNNLPGADYLLANNMYTFRYDGTNWVVQLMYNTNDTAMYTKYYNSILAGEKLTAESIIGGRSDGKFYELSGSGDYFELSYPLLWATSTINSGATNYSSIFTQCYDRNLGTYYTAFNTGGINKIVYLVGTVNGNKFTLNGSTSASYLTCNEPTTENGLFYIPIGRLGNQSNGKNYFNFQVAVPVTLYAYLDGKFRQVTPTEIVATQRIYWRTGTAGTPTAPTSWVTANTNTYAAWATKVPPLAASTASGQTKYPYLYTCEQRKRLDGTVECTPVLLDENTTVIDGGTIITNSIHANKITAGTMETGAFTSTAQKTILNSEIVVSATNLIRNGDFSNGVNYWAKQSSSDAISSETDSTFGHAMKFVQGSAGSTNNRVYTDINTNFTHVSGEQYALSFYAKASASNTITVNVAGQNASGSYLNAAAVTTTWKRYEAQVTAGAAGSLTFWIGSAGTLYLADVMLVHGNKSVDWSPDPRDTSSGISSAQTTANTANNRAVAYRGTCGTATGTAAKVVDCTGFSLVAGATVSVYTTTSNSSAGKLTMNVNSTGAKDVYVGDTVTSDTNRLLWHLGTTLTFTYDGSHWCLTDAPGNYYGTECSTAIATAKKQTKVQAGVIFKGVQIEVPMQYANTAAAPTLAVQNIAATASELSGNILYGIGTVAPTQANGCSWLAGASVQFRYDGKNWRTGSTTDMAVMQASQANLALTSGAMITPSAYNGLTFYLSEPLEADVQYTLKLWNVDVLNSGAANVDVRVYYCGGNVSFGGWTSPTYFTNGHADELTMTFTPTSANVTHSTVLTATTKFIVLYNIPNSGELKSLTVERWKLVKGSSVIGWSSAPSEAVSSADSSVEYIVGTQLAATGAWSGVSKDSSLVAGKTIAYKLPFAGSGNATLELILGNYNAPSPWSDDATGSDVTGVNLLKNSATMQVGTSSWANGVWRTAGGSGGMTKSRVQITDGPNGSCYGVQAVGTQTLLTDMTCWGIDSMPRQNSGYYQFSMYARVVGGGVGMAGFCIYSATRIGHGNATEVWGETTSYNTKTLDPSGAWTRIWCTYRSTSTSGNIYIGAAANDSTSKTVQICNVKIEKLKVSSAAVYSMTTRVTTHYPAASVIQMSYDGTYWRTAGWYYNNNYDRRLHNNYIKAESAVASGKLACATSAGYKAVAAGVEFDLAYPILWAGGAWTAGSQYANAYEAYPSVNPATTATVQGIAVNSMVYLKGTVSGGTFVVASTNFLTCTVPTSEDGYYYIPLGIVANDATTKMYFSTSDKLYAYYENSFQRVDVSATTRAIAAGKKADDVNSALGTLQTTVTSQIQNLGDSVQVSVNSITSRLDSQDEILSDVTNTFDFTADGLVIGKSDSPVKSVLDNQALRFQAHAQDVMVLNGESSTAEMDRLKIGKYRWTSVDGGNAIALMYVG